MGQIVIQTEIELVYVCSGEYIRGNGCALKVLLNSRDGLQAAQPGCGTAAFCNVHGAFQPISLAAGGVSVFGSDIQRNLWRLPGEISARHVKISVLQKSLIGSSNFDSVVGHKHADPAPSGSASLKILGRSRCGKIRSVVQQPVWPLDQYSSQHSTVAGG